MDKLTQAVGCTLGPAGQNVVIEMASGFPHVTKDGVTVAKSIVSSDRYENLGMQIIKQASTSTAENAGDGTTSSTVLAHSFFHAGKKLIAANYDKTRCLKGMSRCVNDALTTLDKFRKEVNSNEELQQISTISANGDVHIGKLISDAFKQVGTDGAIHVTSAKGFKHYLDISEGFELKRGFLSPYFITDTETSRCVFENPRIIIFKGRVSELKQVLTHLESAHKDSSNLFIIAHDIDGEALKTLALNAARGALKVCAIKAPEFGQPRIDATEDLIQLFNAEKVTDDTNGMVHVHVGSCEKIVCYKNSTTFIGTPHNSSSIADRVSKIRDSLDDPRLDDVQQSIIRRRIARLTGKVANIYVGAATETELFEITDRVDDALQAARAASEEGIVAGGGLALAKISYILEKEKFQDRDFSAGYHAAREALLATFKRIIENSGRTPEVTYERLAEKDFEIGFNAGTGQYEDLISAGVIDPVKVVKASLTNGFSAAKMLLTIGCAVVEDVQFEEEDVKIINVLDQ